MENNQLFIVLVRLKSYLMSVIDSREDANDDPLYFTKEYLERKYSEDMIEILESITKHGIKSDVQITFDDDIHFKFQQLIEETNQPVDLISLLENMQIKAEELQSKEKHLDEIKNKRSEDLKRIITIIFQMAKFWTRHQKIEDDVEDYSRLEDEDMIRPEEEKKLYHLDKTAYLSFDNIAQLTKIYLELLTEYYFDYGGNINLEKFLKELDGIKTEVEEKYQSLLRKFGLDEI